MTPEEQKIKEESYLMQHPVSPAENVHIPITFQQIMDFVQNLPLEYQIVLKYWLNVQIKLALNPESVSEPKKSNFDASKYQKESGKGKTWAEVEGKIKFEETDAQIKQALQKLS